MAGRQRRVVVLVPTKEMRGEGAEDMGADIHATTAGATTTEEERRLARTDSTKGRPGEEEDRRPWEDTSADREMEAGWTHPEEGRQDLREKEGEANL